MQFYKYQGTGNDFIMLDNRNEQFTPTTEYIAFLCHRRFGIGADGLILIEKDATYDFRMVYYNSDGNEGSMCGNGGRCAVKFAYDLGIFTEKTTFIAVDGEHEAVVDGENVSLKMIDVTTVEQQANFDFMNTGSPHYVTFKENLANLDVFTEGKAIRYSDEWMKRGGTNVNFVELQKENTISVRTYERGVEDETYSCGTGVTACAIAAYLNFHYQPPIKIRVLGGNLTVDFKAKSTSQFGDIYLIGPAVRVFEGNI